MTLNDIQVDFEKHRIGRQQFRVIIYDKMFITYLENKGQIF